MKQPHKPVSYVSNFSKAAWIIRIITMSAALISIVYYLIQYNQGKLPFQKNKSEMQRSDSYRRIKIPVGRAKDN